jgi:hypothetical protein
MAQPYLNGCFWWLRKKVPDDLRPILGKTEEKFKTLPKHESCSPRLRQRSKSGGRIYGVAVCADDIDSIDVLTIIKVTI